MDRFFLIVTRKARRNAPKSQAVGKIYKKSYVIFQFCNGTGGLTVENRVDVTIWLKTAPKRAKTALFFRFLGGAPRVLEWNMMKCAEIVAQLQNYSST